MKPRGVPEAKSPTPPQFQAGAVGADGQPELPGLATSAWDALGKGARRQALHEDLAAAVDEGEGGPTKFAVKLDKRVSDVSRRLRRAPDDHDTVQIAPLDYVAELGAPARRVFLERLCVRWGFRPPEPLRPLTAEERADILARLTSDQVKRDEERRRGLRPGVLG